MLDNFRDVVSSNYAAYIVGALAAAYIVKLRGACGGDDLISAIQIVSECLEALHLVNLESDIPAISPLGRLSG